MRNLWDPNFYSESRERSLVMHYEMRMKDEVDGAILEWAVNYASQRYPYFKVRIDVQGEELVVNPNPLPIVVREGIDKPVPLCSGESNFHTCAVIYEGKTIFFELSHMMSDGQGRQPWVKSILYYYLQKRYNIELDPTGVNLVDSPISEEEIGDPYPHEIPADLTAFFEQRKSSWMRLKDYEYVEKDWTPSIYKLTFDEAEYMSVCKKYDSSPITLVTALMAKGIQDLHGSDTVYPITALMCLNQRPALKCPKNYHFLIGALRLRFEQEALSLPLETIGTMVRGQVMLTSDEDNVLAQYRDMQNGVKYLESLPTLAEKRRIARLKKGFTDATFGVSYVRKVDYGSAMPYIDKVFPHIGMPGMNPLLELNAMSGKFYLVFCQNFKSDAYVKAFQKQLSALGVDSLMEGPEPHIMPIVDLD